MAAWTIGLGSEEITVRVPRTASPARRSGG